MIRDWLNTAAYGPLLVFRGRAAPVVTAYRAEVYLRASLAACAAWQSATNTSNATDALGRIYLDGLPRPANGQFHTRGELEGYRPYAIIWNAERQGYTQKAYSASGDLMIRISRTSPDAAGDSPSHDANQTFKNLIGTIIGQLCDLAGVAGYLAFHTITLLNGPYWPDKADIETCGLFQTADLLVQW